MLADDLVGQISFEPLSTGVPRYDPPLRVKQEDGVIRCSFNQQTILLGLSPGLQPFFVKLYQRVDLRSQDDRIQGFAEKVHGTKQIPLLQLTRLRIVGRQKDDRR